MKHYVVIKHALSISCTISDPIPDLEALTRENLIVRVLYGIPFRTTLDVTRYVLGIFITGFSAWYSTELGVCIFGTGHWDILFFTCKSTRCQEEIM